MFCYAVSFTIVMTQVLKKEEKKGNLVTFFSMYVCVVVVVVCLFGWFCVFFLNKFSYKSKTF
jgi:hypothetical protein